MDTRERKVQASAAESRAESRMMEAKRKAAQDTKWRLWIADSTPDHWIEASRGCREAADGLHRAFSALGACGATTLLRIQWAKLCDQAEEFEQRAKDALQKRGVER